MSKALNRISQSFIVICANHTKSFQEFSRFVEIKTYRMVYIYNNSSVVSHIEFWVVKGLCAHMYQNQAQHTLPHTPWITNTCFCRVSRSLGLFLVVEQKQTYTYIYPGTHSAQAKRCIFCLPQWSDHADTCIYTMGRGPQPTRSQNRCCPKRYFTATL